jgi:hypothetical protein
MITAKQTRARAFKRQRNKQAAIKGKKPLRDAKYLAWLHSQECAVPSCTSRNLHQWIAAGAWIEAAHVGERGLRQKCSDREAIALCAFHHRIGPYSHHILGRKFWAHHGLDRDALIAEFNERYERETV